MTLALRQLAEVALATRERWGLAVWRHGRALAGFVVDPPWHDGEEEQALEGYRLALCALETAAQMARQELPDVGGSEKTAGYQSEEWRTGA